jgi:hypothetical protein
LRLRASRPVGAQFDAATGGSVSVCAAPSKVHTPRPAVVCPIFWRTKLLRGESRFTILVNRVHKSNDADLSPCLEATSNRGEIAPQARETATERRAFAVSRSPKGGCSRRPSIHHCGVAVRSILTQETISIYLQAQFGHWMPNDWRANCFEPVPQMVLERDWGDATAGDLRKGAIHATQDLLSIVGCGRSR